MSERKRTNFLERVGRLQFINDRIKSGGATCNTLLAEWEEASGTPVVVKTVQRDIYLLNDHGANIEFNHKTVSFEMQNKKFDVLDMFKEAGLKVPEPKKDKKDEKDEA